jgi:hypothetical protein
VSAKSERETFLVMLFAKALLRNKKGEEFFPIPSARVQSVLNEKLFSSSPFDNTLHLFTFSIFHFPMHKVRSGVSSSFSFSLARFALDGEN